jgi:hypothetical protein
MDNRKIIQIIEKDIKNRDDETVLKVKFFPFPVRMEFFDNTIYIDGESIGKGKTGRIIGLNFIRAVAFTPNQNTFVLYRDGAGGPVKNWH